MSDGINDGLPGPVQLLLVTPGVQSSPLAPELLKARELLWLRHGCPHEGLYGDDGEMQCNTCMLDFKRDSMAHIEERFRQRGLSRLLAAQREGRLPMPGELPESEAKPLLTRYRNYRGEESVRWLMPRYVFYGTTPDHPKPQWFMHSLDVEKQAERTFALDDMVRKP